MMVEAEADEVALVGVVATAVEVVNLEIRRRLAERKRTTIFET